VIPNYSRYRKKRPVEFPIPKSILYLGSVLVFSTSAMAQDYIVDLQPGLYSIASSVSAPGRGVLLEDQDEHCLQEPETKKTLQDLLSEIVEGGQCEITNVTQTMGQAAADGTCYDPEMQTTTNGRLEGTWSATSYSVTGRATISGTGGQAILTSKTNAHRLGDCP